MDYIQFKDKYPVYTTTVEKKDRSLDDLVEYFQAKIKAHPIAGFITVFDHYAYTSAKEEHNIAEEITGVKNVVFCFGKEIPNVTVPAVRPRSIAVVETKENFTVSFLEAPNEKLTQVMIEWVKEL